MTFFENLQNHISTKKSIQNVDSNLSTFNKIIETADCLDEQLKGAQTQSTSSAENLDGVKPNKFSRRLLLILSDLCYVDLVEQFFSPVKGNNYRLTDSSNEFKRVLFNASRENSNGFNFKKPMWTKLFRAYYIYFTMKLMLNFYLQHKYNMEIYKFEVGLKTGLHKEFDELTIESLKRINSTQADVKAIGAPYIHLGFVLEVGYMLLLTILLPAYLQTQVFFAYIKPLDLSILRCLIDPRLEQKNVNQLIHEQVDKYIISSENFVKNSESFANSSSGVHGRQFDLFERYHWINHQRIKKLIEKLMLNGSLQPINRQPEWIDMIGKFFFRAFIVIQLIGCSIIGFVSYYLPFFGVWAHPKHKLGLLDGIFLIEHVFLCIIGASSIIFYLVTIIVCCSDQIKAVQYILEQLYHCRQSNVEELERYEMIRFKDTRAYVWNKKQLSHVGTDHQIIRKNNISCISYWQCLKKQAISNELDLIHLRVNANLILALLHYKMFVAQFRPIRMILSFFMFSCLMIMIIMPLLGRMYINHLRPNDRPVVAMVGVVFVGCVDTILILLAYFHSRCQEIYQALSSLEAHSIAEVDLWKSLSGCEIYDKHLIWLLRKELSHPERLTKRLTTKFLGQEVTYPNLLRLHFWIGLFNLYLVSYEYMGNNSRLLSFF